MWQANFFIKERLFLFFLIWSSTKAVLASTCHGKKLCPDGKTAVSDVSVSVLFLFDPIHKETDAFQCCVFYDLRDDLQENLFHNECGEEGRNFLSLTNKRRRSNSQPCST